MTLRLDDVPDEIHRRVSGRECAALSVSDRRRRVGRVTERFSIVVDPIPWIPLDPLVPESVDHPYDGINMV